MMSTLFPSVNRETFSTMPVNSVSGTANEATGTLGQPGLGTSEVRISCLTGHCDDGHFRWTLVDCGCPTDIDQSRAPTALVATPESARDAVCSEPNCQPGQYASNGVCRECEAGFYKSWTGPSACQPCAQGTFTNSRGSTECAACPAGKLQAQTGQTVCDFCPPGTFSDSGSSSCVDCPYPEFTATALVDYTGAGFSGCGNFVSTGFWALAAQGTVGAGGRRVEWSISRTESVSRGVEHTDTYSREFGLASGESTSFETTFGVTVTGGVGGTELFPVKLETSVENSVTTGESVHYEVSESATNSISRAVSEVITNTEETACLQSCSYDANNPDRVNGFIYNWVETLYDVDMLEVTHFFLTCRTVCKYDSAPPLCPPGFCANTDCDRCTPGAFQDPEVDAFASSSDTTPTAPTAPTPTAPTPTAPTPSPTPDPNCFSSVTTVEVEGHGITRMDALKIGDSVLTADGTYSKVYSFGHFAPQDETEFLQIHLNSMNLQAVEITADHMLYVYMTHVASSKRSPSWKLSCHATRTSSSSVFC